VRRTSGNPSSTNTVVPVDDAAILTALREDAEVVSVVVVESGVAAHPADDIVLAIAVTAGYLYLVTGDRQLRILGCYPSVAIVSPRAFLALVVEAKQRVSGDVSR